MKADIDLWPDGRSPSERERNTEMPNGRSVVFISFAAPVPMAAFYSPSTRLLLAYTLVILNSPQ